MSAPRVIDRGLNGRAPDDILDIIFAWGPATPWPGNRCDLNRDGQIDLQDIMIVLSAWR